jgi:hypothetical protein
MVQLALYGKVISAVTMPIASFLVDDRNKTVDPLNSELGVDGWH